jgi:DNA polymerase-3 subunit beta
MFEVIVQRSIFVKALSHVQSVVERKNVSGITSHLKLDANTDNLTITAIDTGLSINETIPAEVKITGSLTLPAHTLYEIVRKFSDEEVSLKIAPEQNSMVEISSGYAVFHLSFLASEEFPKIDGGSFECKFNLSGALLQKMIEKNRNTISQEDSRYHLNGIFFHPIQSENKLRATATDGHRLSSVSIELPKNAEHMPPIIIPRKSIFEILKILTDNPTDVIVEISPVKIRLTIGDVIIVSKLIDADFPDYLGLIPTNNSLYFSLSSVDFSRAVDRVSTIMMEKSQAIKLNINQNEMQLSTDGNYQSLANEKLEIDSNIENFEISFNAKYLLDIMAVLDSSDDVEFKLSDPFSAALVRAQKDQESEFVLMPMRV